MAPKSDKTSQLRIAEHFTSIQGEGIWAGTPSTFIRVSGCNLRCTWCDTPYASWEPEGEVRDVEALWSELHPIRTRHVVITGGEPMLFDGTESLAQKLRDHGYVITIETAGTVFRSVACDLMSISPKLSNSTPQDPNWRDRHEALRADIEPLRRLVEAYPYQLKFVVTPDAGDDIAEIDSLLSRLPIPDPDRILLMPEGRDSETLLARSKKLVPICISRGWRLCTRLQIDLFGDTRGT